VPRRRNLAEQILELASLHARQAAILREMGRTMRDSGALPAPVPSPPSRRPSGDEPKDPITFTELEVQRARRHARRLGYPIRRKP
jgi:hypothetical protein